MPDRRNKTEDDITADTLQRFSQTPDPRLRQIILALVKHLHAFVKEVELTEAEWFRAIGSLTEAGRMCSDKRQEFILFSDTLGVSMVVDLSNHPKPDGATESTVFGPFHRLGAPELPAGGNIARLDETGTPALVSGRVLGQGFADLRFRAARHPRQRSGLPRHRSALLHRRVRFPSQTSLGARGERA